MPGSKKSWVLAILTLAVIFNACSNEKFELSAPAHFPEMQFPADNALTPERVALGQKMFFDKNLSLDSTIACSSCHLPEKAFTDGKSISPGIKGRLGKRNSPSILNAGYLSLINKDGGVRSLDLQPLVPLEDENEMGITIQSLTSRLLADEEYNAMAMKAYGKEIDAFVITRSLSSFVRTLISGTSDYDRYLSGDTLALDQQARKGLALFSSNRLNCSACHSGFNLTDNTFQNNGLYEQYDDLGRALITLDSADQGKFRVPSLRNVAITGPYMHDGSLSSLDTVIDHYESLSSKPKPMQSKSLKPFQLTPGERAQLKSFLYALTDSSYLAGQREHGEL